MLRRFCLLFLLLIPTLAVAEKYALLVGINDYPNDISPLRYCVADVVAFRDALVNVAGFEKDNVYLMTDDMDGQMQPTNINIVKRLDILSQRIKAGDTLVFYFSGHGIVNDGSSFLLAVNSDTSTQNTLEMSAVPLDRVSKILSSVKAQQLLTVIDACRNNPETGRSGEDNILTDDFSKGFKIRRSSSSNGQPSVSATLYACNVGERAYEWSEKGHGVFSYYLLEGLNGKAANSQGQVTVTGLAEYTQSKVVDWAETYRNKKQTPWLSLQGGAKLVLAEGVSQSAEATIPTKVVPTIDTEAEMWAMVKDSNNPNDIQEFLAMFPEGKLAKVAAFKLRKLQPESAQNPSLNSIKSKPDQMIQDETSQAEPNQPEKQPNLKEDSKPKGKFLSKVLSVLKVLKHEMSQLEKEADHQEALTQITRAKDDSLMVLIPAGPDTESFYMDQYEVTNAQYRKFVDATGHREPEGWDNDDFNQPNQPVVGVSWHDAVAYTKWVGKRLPTEKEWEYSARGGLINKVYPWGDDESLARDYANYSRTSGKDKWGCSAPIGSFKPNGYGLYDMAGNVWEWCNDWYDIHRHTKVLRGGSWSNITLNLRLASRNHFSLNAGSTNYGFRCVSGSN